MKEKVKTDKGMPAKEAKEVVVPMAKKFFNIDITGYEAKWDDKSKNYSFFKYGKDNKGAKVEKNDNESYIRCQQKRAVPDV
ncbi:hypothetical protein ABES58_24240 [Paenibacillus lautus]|uniref:hypothetical protein n=1 Tax=Paenibacillus lautus TaxID=1401 RepID=UPI003D26FA2F